MSDQTVNAPDVRNDPEKALLNRLVLWIEKEAHLAGADIEAEITSILTKLRAKR